MQIAAMGVTVLALLITLSLAVPAPLAQEKAPTGAPQTVCPVMGGQISKEVFVDYQGQRIYFCCPVCIEIFKKDPEAYLKKMKEAGVTPEKVPAKK